MTISMAQAKALCTGNELEIVQSSTRTEIGKLSAARLRQKVTQARKLRDKWRDQSIRQQRETQSKQGGRSTDDNARSAKKAELFSEVLDRFSMQLKIVESSGGGTIGPRQQPSRTSRTGQHRRKRAATRKVMEEKRQALTSIPPDSHKTAAGGQTRKKTVKKAAPPTAAAEAQPSDHSQSTATDSPTSTARPRKATGKDTVTRPLEAGRKAQGLKVTKKSQLQARAAAKRNRLKIGGRINTHKHLSAANKRRQARRDSR